MTDLAQAIETYNALLDNELGQASQAQLNDQLHRRELFFGERPLCTVLRPRFLTPGQYDLLRHAIAAVMPAFARLHAAALADPDLRAHFGLADWEEHLLETDPGFAASSPTARMDSFFTGDELWFTEYNAETPAAPAYCDVLAEVFLGLPIMQRFERQYELRPLPGRHQVLAGLLRAYEQWGGREKPRIAILDWREVPTYSEFVLFQDYFRSQGFECLIADPRQFEYRNGVLVADGITPIQLIYKRVLISELVEREGLDHPVIRAVRDGAACMVNPFRCKILHKKASLAILSDEAHRDLFSAEQARSIDQFIPWTRIVSDRRTTYQGQPIDLLPFLADHRQDFVLKPNDEYGGKGIVLGWDVSADEWAAGLQTALSEPHIVQRRVPVPAEPYPSLVGGRVEILDRMLDTNPFVWQDQYASGCLTRLSTAALLNVTAGGGSSVPTFVVEKREVS
jgi:hypothetical protein